MIEAYFTACVAIILSFSTGCYGYLSLPTRAARIGSSLSNINFGDSHFGTFNSPIASQDRDSCFQLSLARKQAKESSLNDEDEEIDVDDEGDDADFYFSGSDDGEEFDESLFEDGGIDFVKHETDDELDEIDLDEKYTQKSTTSSTTTSAATEQRKRKRRRDRLYRRKYPVVAVVGRPNVGKSTLVNRICETHNDGAIVHDEAGVTRDRTYRKAFWYSKEGVGLHHFEVVDTGGLIFDEEDFVKPMGKTLGGLRGASKSGAQKGKKRRPTSINAAAELGGGIGGAAGGSGGRPSAVAPMGGQILTGGPRTRGRGLSGGSERSQSNIGGGATGLDLVEGLGEELELEAGAPAPSTNSLGAISDSNPYLSEFGNKNELYAEQIREQALAALREASAAILVVDGQSGLTPLDEEIGRFLRQEQSKYGIEPHVPIIVAVNKCESRRLGDIQAQEFWKLGLGEPHPVSGIHGNGVAELLDTLCAPETLPTTLNKNLAKLVEMEGRAIEEERQGRQGRVQQMVGAQSGVGSGSEEKEAKEGEEGEGKGGGEVVSAVLPSSYLSEDPLERIKLKLRKGEDIGEIGTTASSTSTTTTTTTTTSTSGVVLAGSTGGGEEELNGCIDVAIVGRPNVGKSSLLNRLVGKPRAIVSPHAGTTRDTIDCIVEKHRPGLVQSQAQAQGQGGKPFVGRRSRKLDSSSSSSSSGGSGVKSATQNKGFFDGRWDADDFFGHAKDPSQSQSQSQTEAQAQLVKDLKVEEDDLDDDDSEAYRAYRFIDTAGIRRRSKVSYGSEFFMINRALKAIRRGHVSLLVLDATEGVSYQDHVLAERIRDDGRACVILVNKWDAVGNKDDTTYKKAVEYIRTGLPSLKFAPVLFISATEGQRVPKIYDAIDVVLGQHRRRAKTSVLNEVVRDAVLWQPPPTTRNGNQGKIYYVNQVSTEPPTIAVFCNNPKLFNENYQRYLERKVRQALGFEGTPIRWLWRGRSLRKTINMAGGNAKGRGGTRKGKIDGTKELKRNAKPYAG